MRKLNWGLIACSLIGAVLMIALPILGAINLAKTPARWPAVLALIGYAIVGMKLSGGDEGPVKIAAGGTAGMVFAFFGMLISLALIIKPGKRA